MAFKPWLAMASPLVLYTSSIVLLRATALPLGGCLFQDDGLPGRIHHRPTHHRFLHRPAVACLVRRGCAIRAALRCQTDGRLKNRLRSCFEPSAVQGFDEPKRVDLAHAVRTELTEGGRHCAWVNNLIPSILCYITQVMRDMARL